MAKAYDGCLLRCKFYKQALSLVAYHQLNRFGLDFKHVGPLRRMVTRCAREGPNPSTFTVRLHIQSKRDLAMHNEASVGKGEHTRLCKSPLLHDMAPATHMRLRPQAC